MILPSFPYHNFHNHVLKCSFTSLSHSEHGGGNIIWGYQWNPDLL